MADPVTLTHPLLKGVEIVRDPDVARVLAKSGWVAQTDDGAADPAPVAKNPAPRKRTGKKAAAPAAADPVDDAPSDDTPTDSPDQGEQES